MDSRTEEKDFDKESLLPGLLEYLKDLSGGRLYGLVPDFYARAIYFNKDLFIEHGVELPNDRMTWDDLFRLAAMFPPEGSEDDRIYGLDMGYSAADLFQLGTMIGSSQNLSIVDASMEQVTINSDAWKQVFDTALTAWKFLKYVTGNEYARVTAKRQTGSMPVRTKYLKDEEGHNLAAFYALKPQRSAMVSVYPNLDEPELIKAVKAGVRRENSGGGPLLA